MASWARRTGVSMKLIVSKEIEDDYMQTEYLRELAKIWGSMLPSPTCHKAPPAEEPEKLLKWVEEELKRWGR